MAGTDINQIEITSLNHIQGQPKVVAVLKLSLDAYFANRTNDANTSFGPVLMVGPSGTGKTLTAKAVHCELGNLKLIETNGENALKWKYESDNVLMEIAKRSKQTPRLALNRNLFMCWNVCSSQGRDKGVSSPCRPLIPEHTSGYAE